MKRGNGKWEAAKVTSGNNTSNASLKFFFDAPDLKEEAEFSTWIEKLKSNGHLVRGDFKNVHIAYQFKENSYHARSFEDAFIALNLSDIASKKERIEGLKNRSDLDTSGTVDFYELTTKVIDKKSDFASSILFEALANDHSWCVPSYISEGSKWLHKD